MKITDPIIAPSRGNAATAIAYALANGAARFADVTAYINEVYRLANLTGVDAAVAIAQSSHETDIWRSQWFRDRLNVAGIGITGDPTQNNQSRTWANGVDAARSQIAHLLLYATGAIPAPLSIDDDPRYVAYIAAFGNRPVATTIADLAGRWAVDPDYATGIVRHGNAIFPDLDTVTGASEPMAVKPYILIVAGHRSHGDHGNPGEKELTPALAAEYTRAFRAAGYRADWYQRDVDRDSDPDDTVGGLDTVALGCGRHLASIPGPKVMLDCHFNGYHSPVHVIVPDTTGLRTAYAGGAPNSDTYGGNTLDRRLAAKIAQGLAPLGFSLYRGRASEPGVMIEPETGVGRQGYRLAMFAATAGVRVDTVRLVIEHGGSQDAPVLRNDFTNRCAPIVVAAVNDVYGVTTDEPAPTPAPVPTPTPPTGSYVKPDTSWMGDDGTNKPTDHTITVDGQEIKVFACRRSYEALKSTWRYQGPKSGGPKVGPRLNVREQFYANYFAVVGKTRWIVTPAGSWLLASALTPRVSVRPA